MAAYRLELADGAGTRGSLTLELPDDGGPARYEVVLAGPALGPGVVVVRDDEVPRPRGRLLEVRADGLWAELVCETPGEHWGFGLEAFGLRYDREEDAATSDVGERLPVGLDLEWEVAAGPGARRPGREEPGAPVPGTVRGELLLGRARIPFDGTGTLSAPAVDR